MIKNLIIFFRSVIFFLFFIVSTIVLFIFLIIANIIRNKKLLNKVSVCWAKTIIEALRIICKIEYVVEGYENLPDNNNYLVVSKHQSTWETYFLYYFFKNRTAFVLKKELLSVPIIGYGLKRTGHLPIDRKGGISAIKKMVDEADKIINEEHRKIVIFPQGTRTPINSDLKKYPYKSGFLSIVKNLKLDILPIALNTGCFWPKKSFLKKSGKIIIKIMPVIKYSNIENLKKEEIIEKVQNIIETESNKLIVDSTFERD